MGPGVLASSFRQGFGRLGGGEFPNTDSLRGLFGSLGPVLARWRSGAEAEAASPASAPGRDLPLAVSASASRSTYEFGRPAVVFSVSVAGGASSPASPWGRMPSAAPGTGSLLDVWPGFASAGGDSQVRVYGEFSQLVGVTLSLSPLVCDPVAAASPSWVACTAPASPGAGFVALSVGSSAGSQLVVDGSWLGEALQFEYVVPGSVLSAWPRPLTWRGGDVVWLASTGVRPDLALGGCVLGGSPAGPSAVAASSALVACELPGVSSAPGDAVLALAPSAGQVPPVSALRVALVEALSFASVSPGAVSADGGTRVELEGVQPGDVADASCWLGTLGPLAGQWSGGGRLSCVSPAVFGGGQSAGIVLYGVGVGPAKHTQAGATQSVFPSAVGADLVAWPPVVVSPHGGAVSVLGWDGAGAFAGVAVSCDLGAGDARVLGSASPAPFVGVSCVLPGHAVGFTTLGLVDASGVPVAGSQVEVSYVASPAVVSAQPSGLWSVGGAPVVVTGSGFVPTASPACVFGGSAAGGVLVSSVLAVCEAPVSAPGASEVGVAGMLGPGASFEFWPGAGVVQSSAPSEGAVVGGTSVTVLGAGLPARGALECWFGSVRVSASWLSGGGVQCSSPAGASSGSVVPVLVGAGGGTQFADGSGAHTYTGPSFGLSVAASAASLSVGELLACPPGLGGLSCVSGPPGFAVVRLGAASAGSLLATAGADDVYGDAVLTLRLPARVLGAGPGRAPVFGGAVVSVLGSGLGLSWESGMAVDGCVFGPAPPVAGAVVSSALVMCESPPASLVGGALSVALGTQPRHRPATPVRASSAGAPTCARTFKVSSGKPTRSAHPHASAPARASTHRSAGG